MANNIEYVKLYQKGLDEDAVQEAKTGWMEVNASQVKYSGGKEVKIPKRTMDGLADYDRENGYANGSITVSYETRTMSQDRGRRFQLDAMDYDESGFVISAIGELAAFQTKHVIPEVDAFRLASLYKVADACGHVTTYSPSTSDILAKIKADITKVRKAGGKNIVIHITYDALSLLEIALAGQLRNTTWSQGGIDTQVPAIDGCPLIATADDRMYKELNIDKDNGYSGSGVINWIVMDGGVPIAISKTDVPRVFAPSDNQYADAWIITYRKYHDIWVADNKRNLIYANVQSGGSGGNISGVDDGNITPFVVLNKDAITVTAAAGDDHTFQLNANTFPVGATVTWASSVQAKATVSNTGLVTGAAAGDTVVSATITYAGKNYKAECAVTVE